MTSLFRWVQVTQSGAARLHPVTSPASVQRVTGLLILTINSTSVKLGSEKRLFATSSRSPNKENELKFPSRNPEAARLARQDKQASTRLPGPAATKAEPEEVETGLGRDENGLYRRRLRRETV